MASGEQQRETILKHLGHLLQKNGVRKLRVVVIADVDQTLARQSYLASLQHGVDGVYHEGHSQSLFDELFENFPNGNWDMESVAGKVSSYPPVREILRIVSKLAYRTGFGFGLYEGAKEAISRINPSALYLISISPHDAAKAIKNEFHETREMEIYAIGNDYRGSRPLISSSNKEELISRIIAHEISNHGDENEMVIVLMGNSPHDIPELAGKTIILGDRTYRFERGEGNYCVMHFDNSSMRFRVYKIAVNPKPGMYTEVADEVLGKHSHYKLPRAIRHIIYYLTAMFGKSPFSSYKTDTH